MHASAGMVPRREGLPLANIVERMACFYYGTSENRAGRASDYQKGDAFYNKKTLDFMIMNR